MSLKSHKITTKSTETIQNKAVRRCDQCYNKHIRCDKIVPVCNQCKKSKLSCTRTRKYKYTAVPQYEKVEDYFLNGKINLNKIFNTQGIILNTSIPDVLEKDSSSITSSVSQPIKKNNFINASIISFKDNDCKIMLKNMVYGLNFWLDFFCIAKTLGVSVYDSNCDNFIVVNYIHKVKRILPSLQKSSQVATFFSNLTEDLDLSVKAYFHYVNPFFPLFSFKQFSSKPRSRFLNMCIQRIGLQFLPKTNQRNEFSTYLDKFIQNQVKPSKITPSFDSLQALLVLIYGALSPTILNCRRSLYHIVVSWIHLLGLEIIKKHSDLTEIQAIVNCIHGLDYLFSFDYDVIFLKPLSFPTTQSLDSISLVSCCHRLSSSVLKTAFYYLHQPFLKINVISQILSKYDSATIKLLASLSTRNSQDHLVDIMFIKLQYHFIYLMILDLVFKLETQKIDSLDPQLLRIFRQSGYFHSVSTIRYLITVSNGPFIFNRNFILLTAARVLNSWASPHSPSLYPIIKRIIIRTNVEPTRYYDTSNLSLLDELFSINQSENSEMSLQSK